MKNVLFGILLSCAAVIAVDVSPALTSGAVNGRFWSSLTEDTKCVYLLGLQEGVVVGGGPDGVVRLYRSEATRVELAAGIDEIYRKPENAGLPVFMVLKIFTLKVKGATPADVELLLAEARYTMTQTDEAKKSAKK